MSTRFGYPNIKVGKLSNEQNIQNTKSFLYAFSESTSQYIENLENKVNTLEGIIENMAKSKEV
jgi:hypothetical protein|nr:MAG TPA: zipper dimerization domain transcription factor-like protein [Caudoviricetes sp.]